MNSLAVLAVKGRVRFRPPKRLTPPQAGARGQSHQGTKLGGMARVRAATASSVKGSTLARTSLGSRAPRRVTMRSIDPAQPP